MNLVPTYLIYGYVFFGLTLFFNPKNHDNSSVKILPPPDGVEFIHFGFQQSFSDLLWLSYIQNNWDCSKYVDPNGEKCPYRWGYRVLKSASELDPKYKVLAKHGATKLTVIQDDHHGAEDIFLRGLVHYPQDWELNYKLAYLYLEELKDDEKAANYLNIAASNGAPLWAKSLASKLYSKAGKKELSFSVLKQLYDQTERPEMKKNLEKRLMVLAAEIRSISSDKEK